MKASEAMIVWNEADIGGGEVLVVRHPVETLAEHRRQEKYLFSDGACYTDWRNASAEKQMAWIMEVFRQLTVVVGIAPTEVDKEFMKIDEYKTLFGKSSTCGSVQTPERILEWLN